MNWEFYCSKFREKLPDQRAPSWSNYLTFAWPPLSWDGKELSDIAVYDLEHQPTTYDFVCWLSLVKTLGAKDIHFAFERKLQDWKYGHDEGWKRFGNILVPLCGLMGFNFTVGPRREGFTTAYRWGHVNALYKLLGEIELLYAKPEPEDYVTITVRDTIKFKYKNSSREVWEEVRRALEARGENVVWLDDCDTTGTILEPWKRLDLYRKAKCNLGSGGPMSLALFSECPYLVTNLMPEALEHAAELEKEFKTTLFPVGSQFEFKNSKQLLSWKPDTVKNVMEAYSDWGAQTRE